MYTILKRILFNLNPETAHLLAKHASKLAPVNILSKHTTVSSNALKASLGKTKLKNPIGLASGFDKNAEMLDFLQALGFGFLELGSITASACKGNPKPRIFRLPKDKSIINRMGLPNIGANAFAQRLKRLKTKVPYGINIAKTPDFAQQKDSVVKNGIDDFLETFKATHHLGSYIVFNLSCPNTHDNKTFEDPKLFVSLAKEIKDIKKDLKVTKPVLIKLSPDLKTKNLSNLVDQAIKFGFDGFVLTNTTTSRTNLKTKQKTLLNIGMGGLSGKALNEISTKQLKNVFNITGRKKILIGTGGIMGFDDLLSKFANGASLVQIYTGFIYEGPLFIKRLNEELALFCKKRGLKSYKELVGK